MLPCIAISQGHAVVNGPDYAPPFDMRQAARVEGELRTVSFLDTENGDVPVESASLIFGNKRVAVREFDNKKMVTGRDNQMTLFVNEEPVMNLALRGGYRDSAGQHIPYADKRSPDQVQFITSADHNAVHWTCYYPLPDGTKTAFSYTLRSLGESRVKLSWDIGCTAEQIAQFQAQGSDIGNYLLYLGIAGDYHKDGLSLNGEPVEPLPLDLLKANEKKHQTVWQGEMQDLTYASAQDPLYQVSIHSETGMEGVLREIFWWRRVDLGFMFKLDRPQDSLIIDFGTVSVAKKDAPAPVEGVDMWAQDALHLPDSPTRNLFPNPSLEQGMRYWRWWFGGGYYDRSDILRYQVDRETALFGDSSLVIHPVQTRSQSLRSFSLPNRRDQIYTVSFYAKAEADKGATLRFAPFSNKAGGKFDRASVHRAETFKLQSEWKRYSYQLTADGSPLAFILNGASANGRIWVDGIQFEAGEEATEFVAPAIEGQLITSHHQNNVEYGDLIEAQFPLYGSSEQAVEVAFTLRDFFEQVLWTEAVAAKGGQVLTLPFDSLNLATGGYFLQARYSLGGEVLYDDYYRFTLIDSLDGTHATKDMYGALVNVTDNRSEERIALMQRLGFGGSTSYGPGRMADPMHYELREKFNITGYGHGLFGGFPYLTAEEKFNRHPDYKFGMTLNSRIWRREDERDIETLRTYSPEVLARVESISEKAARLCEEVRVWHIATEEEGTFPSLSKDHNFEEFAKLQEAFYRGIKKGNPDALVLPSGGTSGYGRLRGKDDIDGYLKATAGKVKWDAIAVHPYGSIDGTLGAEDLDEGIQMLKDSMAEYGYGDETPIYLNEGGGGAPNFWGDGPSWSYKGGQPSYDQGLFEFLHASKLARMYLIALKYWPQLQHFNTWQIGWITIVDYNLSPSSAFLGINTLGHMLGNPSFVSDIRPAEGVRGYAFEDEVNGGVAAIWCTIDDVERGFIRGPVMRVQFEEELPELVDLMGRRYDLQRNADGTVEIQLTPAPLFLTGENTKALVAALQDAEITGSGAQVKVAYEPSPTGAIYAEVKNLTGREQSGELVFEDNTVPYQVAPSQSVVLEVSKGEGTDTGVLYRWNQEYSLQESEGEPHIQQWNMDYFYVPRVEGAPDWEQIPAIPITNMFRPVVNMKRTPGGHEGDIAAQYQLAWDEDNLYLRVEAEDDRLQADLEKFWSSPLAQVSQLYLLDGSLEVYFDCGANGRFGSEGYDLDDYRYDFAPNNPEAESGEALVYRLREVFQEYAGGVEFPTKEEAAAGIDAQYTRLSDTRYAYTITFAQKYIAPLKLQAGQVAGFALYLHDRMDDGTIGNKGLSLAGEDGAHCDTNPHLWPFMILAE
ncbi:sugar-binding protein [Coraliomargarita algicola]|uniref:Sugar-binding protein n=1 Tax=Coraliomargarita algicola TaxID=3092156 RepID=A0ABZ0RP27_9BACT|nr:sugar-binding protein [Coraliomargarita sp. J2-16]WPJ96883.1 sugar-binding protein [Coraliomargarita sp. J2-16]